MKQTRKQQQQIIAAAMQDGSINNLFYYMVSDLGGGKDIPAAVNDVVPVVRVGPNPELSEHDAHIMLEICREKSPKMFLRLEITAQDILDDAGVAWIEFGDVDLICPMCAGINWDSCSCQPTLWRVEEEWGKTAESVNACNWLKDLERHWPNLESVPEGADVFEGKYPVTGADDTPRSG